MLSVATPVGAGELVAAAAAATVPAVVQPADAAQARAQLLSVIRGGGDESAVLAAIDWLAPFNPTAAPARSPQLEGEWRLLWSSATAEVTKVRCRVFLLVLGATPNPGVVGTARYTLSAAATTRLAHTRLSSWALLHAVSQRRADANSCLSSRHPDASKAYAESKAARDGGSLA